MDADAQAISCLDIDGDGKPDVCLAGAGRVAVLQNGGDSLNEITIPGLTGGCRAAVWADYNGDGKPDLLLATPNGPKLYTNLGGNLPRRQPSVAASAGLEPDRRRLDRLRRRRPARHPARQRLPRPAALSQQGAGRPRPSPLKLGKWSYIGPFPNPNGQGFAAVYPPEKGVNLKQKFGGKNGEEAAWKEGKFNDGEINNLALFKPENNVDAVVYLYREIESDGRRELPVSLGSDDTLTVWLNGEKIVSENVDRACAPDQTKAVLKLKQGKNNLLMKVCQGGGEWAFYFKATRRPAAGDRPGRSRTFPTRSASAPTASAARSRATGSTVCDVDGDGRPDFLYSAGTGLLVLNTPQGLRRGEGLRHLLQGGQGGPGVRRLRQRRPARPVRAAEGRLQAVPQRRRRQVHRRDGEGRSGQVHRLGDERRLGRRGQRRPARSGGRLSARSRIASSATRATARSRTRPRRSAWTSASSTRRRSAWWISTATACSTWCSTTRARNRACCWAIRSGSPSGRR